MPQTVEERSTLIGVVVVDPPTGRVGVIVDSWPTADPHPVGVVVRWEPLIEDHVEQRSPVGLCLMP